MKVKNIKHMNATLVEAIEDSVFDTGISADKLKNRKIATARVLLQAEKALEAAEKASNDDLASRLQNKINILQDLLAHADDIPTTKPEEPAPLDTGSKGGKGEDSEDGDGGDGSELELEDESNDAGYADGEKGGSSKSKQKKSEDDSEKPEDQEGESENTDESDGEQKDPDRDPGKTKEPKEPKEPTGDPSLPGDPGEPEEPTGDPGMPGDPVESEDDNRIDPFSRRRPTPPTPLPPGKPPKEQESVFEAAKRILSELKGDSRRGAVDGLKELLSNRGIVVEEAYNIQKLTEAIKKTLGQLTDQEFQDILADTMSTVDEIIKVDYSHDLDVRVAEIKRDASSKLSKLELEREDNKHVKADKDPIKSAESENDKYREIGGIAGLEEFEFTLYSAIADQVAEADEVVDSWSALDRRHEDDPSIIVPGKVLDDELDYEIPTINVYFDQSGSWSDSEIKLGMRAISVINEFHERGEIKLNIFYMSAGGIFTTAKAARADGRAEGWHAALEHIKGSKVKNVVVLADDDLDAFEWSNRPTGNNGTTVVDGCVWWLWKNGWKSKKAVKELIGLSGNFEYKFKV